MPVLKIIQAGNPILRRKAVPIQENDFSEMVSLADDLRETLIAAQGVGIAATQVGREVQMLVYRIPASRSEDDGEIPMTVLLNPQLTPLTQEMTVAFEGCLSMPGLTGAVPRFKKIGLRATLLSGKVIEQEIGGFHARVLQHELDHLEGKLYVDRMTDFTSFGFSTELLEAARNTQKKND